MQHRLDAIVERVGDVQTATLVNAVPEPGAFSYELKWDGYRMLAVKAGDAVRLVRPETTGLHEGDGGGGARCRCARHGRVRPRSPAPSRR